MSFIYLKNLQSEGTERADVAIGVFRQVNKYLNW